MQRIAISTAFDENTIRAIAHGAHERGVLSRRAIRNQSPLLAAAHAAHVIGPRSETLTRFISNQRNRIASGALPEDIRVAPSAELVRVLGGRVSSPVTHSIGNARWKVIFDRVASRVDFGDADALISMPGSSLRTFEANRNRRLIFHEIDAHPRTRNDLLEQHYGRRRAVAEMFPDWFVRRIEEEISLSTHVLVPGRVVADQMLAHGIPDSKIIRIPYGVDPTVFKPENEPRGHRSSRLQIVCTAQISLRKGIPFLIEAVRGKNVDLTLVGQVFDRQIVERLPSNVTLAGILSAPQLADLYAESDLFVLPSVEDCFSLVVAEAAGAGLPVVTTNENGAHEVLSERHTIVNAGSVSELAHAIDSSHKLSHAERRLISTEALERGWSDWPTYAGSVLRATGIIE